MADFDFESGVVCLTGPGAGGLGQYARFAIGHSGLRFSHVTGCRCRCLVSCGLYSWFFELYMQSLACIPVRLHLVSFD